MPRRPRAPFVALAALLRRRFPDLDDPVAAIVAGAVVVDGRHLRNPVARVRQDASVRVRPSARLRGEAKLGAALDALGLDVSGAVAVDVGAAAGGFTTALLTRGAARVHAVDVGHGQLRASLRGDPRVVVLERTNVAALDQRLVPEPVDLVTMDLSYLAVAAAVPSLERLCLRAGTALVALVKPTFELRAPALVTDGARVRAAIASATAAVDAAGWAPVACTMPATTGAGGAVEAFLLAHRRVATPG